MSEEESSKPKIFVDDDWKSRAQAEKEQLQRQAAAKQRQEAAGPPPDEPASSPEPEPDLPLPPASFPVLVTTLATQALATLGQIPGADGKPVVQLDHAKHFIDTLGILEEKTKGNLTPAESAMLTDVLHELRLLFVAAGKRTANTANKS